MLYLLEIASEKEREIETDSEIFNLRRLEPPSVFQISF